MDFPGSRHFHGPKFQKVTQGGQRLSLGGSRLLTVSALLGLVRPVGISREKAGRLFRLVATGKRGRGFKLQISFGYPGAIENKIHIWPWRRPICPSHLGQTSSHTAQLARLLHQGTKSQL